MESNPVPSLTCRVCLFFRPSDEPGPGQCRRRSPRAIQSRASSNEYRSVWPSVWGEKDWCGEFQLAPEEV